jgi:hypothetical protein
MENCVVMEKTEIPLSLLRWRVRAEIRTNPAYRMLLDRLGLFPCPCCGRLANRRGCLDKHCESRRK